MKKKEWEEKGMGGRRKELEKNGRNLVVLRNGENRNEKRMRKTYLRSQVLVARHPHTLDPWREKGILSKDIRRDEKRRKLSSLIKKSWVGSGAR